jgi:hypothetical protein
VPGCNKVLNIKNKKLENPHLARPTLNGSSEGNCCPVAPGAKVQRNSRAKWGRAIAQKVVLTELFFVLGPPAKPKHFWFPWRASLAAEQHSPPTESLNVGRAR